MKRIYIIIILLIILNVCLFGFYFYLTYRETSREKLPTIDNRNEGTIKDNKPDNISKIQIAERIYSWIETQKDNRDIYYGNVIYNNGIKAESLVDGRAGLGVIWGQYKLWKKTNNKDILETVGRNLKNYNDPLKVPLLQNDFWNCKLMYDIWSDNSLSVQIKEMAKELCRRGTIYIAEIHKKGPLKPGVRIEGKNEMNLDDFFSSQQNSLSDNKPSIKEVNEMVEETAFISDFVYRKFLDENKENLLIAEELFGNALKKQKESGEKKGLCLLGIAAMDIANGLKEQKYENFAENLFEKKITKRCQGESGCGTDFFENYTCFLFTKEMYRKTKKQIYKDTNDKFFQVMVKNNFQLTKVSEEKGEDAFFTQINYVKEGQNVIDLVYIIKDNGIFMGILSGE